MHLLTTSSDPARIALSRSFTDLAFEMTSADGTMEQNARSGHTVAPHWPGRFKDFAANLSTLRDAFRAAMPEHGDIATGLQADSLNLSFMAGRLDAMVRNQTKYGTYWGTVLDAPIANARAAADALLGS